LGLVFPLHNDSTKQTAALHYFQTNDSCIDESKDFKAPDGTVGETLQKNCQGLKVLLVDERSLIGCTNLGWMEFMWCLHH
jgi:hypothetical protein